MIGIYKITNLVNGKVYIGQSWDIEKRWGEHQKNGRNNHLKKAIEKYGLDNFKFEVLRELSEHGLTQILLDCLEKKYIKEFKSYDPKCGYNKTFGGSNGKRTEETRKKMSEAIKGRVLKEETKQKMSQSGKIKVFSKKHRQKLSEANKGRVFSKEHRQKLSEVNKGKVLTKEHRQKMSDSKSGEKNPNARKIYCLETGEVFTTITQAVEKYGLFVRSQLYRGCLRPNKKTGLSFYFEMRTNNIDIGGIINDKRK